AVVKFYCSDTLLHQGLHVPGRPFGPLSAAHTRRANSFLEELKPSSLERECVEEKCNFEEAHEIFLTREATVNGNQCRSSLCVHGACVDLFQAYACRCEPGYEGRYCNQRESNKGQSDDGLSRSCSCVDGYTLHEDHHNCTPTSSSSCGQLLISRSSYSKPVVGLMPWVVGGEVGKKGESPVGSRQVMVLNARGRLHCGGVLIDLNWVLTAAHCLDKVIRFRVKLGDYERLREEDSEVQLRVVKTFKHPQYNSRPRPLSNYILPVCLPRREMAQRVLHRNGTETVVTGWGKEEVNSSRYSSTLNVIKIPLVERSECSRLMTNNISENVLCAGVLGKPYDACEGDSGGPMVTLHQGTWFLVGLLGIYTKVSNYNEWIEQVRAEWDRTHNPHSG
uniref:Vitamin K-dependent protein C n=1 Tax=Neogobius melanostomus TaxID=47308 RepID=A0A8C6SJB0_9GOBI